MHWYNMSLQKKCLFSEFYFANIKGTCHINILLVVKAVIATLFSSYLSFVVKMIRVKMS